MSISILTRHNHHHNRKRPGLKDSVAMHLKAELPISAYEGNYFNDVYGNMSVVLRKWRIENEIFSSSEYVRKT